jgi:hypothetical protein
VVKIMYFDGRFAPVVVCDICGGRVENANRGAAIFASHRMADGQVRTFDKGTLLDVLHAHKGTCHDRAEQRLGGKLETGWVELAEHLALLIGNTGVTAEEVTQINIFRDKHGLG